MGGSSSMLFERIQLNDFLKWFIQHCVEDSSFQFEVEFKGWVAGSIILSLGLTNASLW